MIKIEKIVLRILGVLAITVSSSAYAGVESATGKIFLGGFTFSQENYLTTKIQLNTVDDEIQVQLSPIDPYSNCIMQFGTGKFEHSYKLLFSNNTLVRYKVPVSVGCSEAGSKIYKLEIVFVEDTTAIKSVRLSPYRNKSYPYFSTEF